MAKATSHTSEGPLIAGPECAAIPMLSARPCESASVAPVKRRGITPSEALEILAKRDVHREDMEDLVVGLIVVQIEFRSCERVASAQAVGSAGGKNDLQTGSHWWSYPGHPEL